MIMNNDLSPQCQRLVNDIVLSTKVLSEIQMDYITFEMKSGLTEGLENLKSTIEVEAFKFYEENEIDVINEVTIPILTNIARTAYVAGLWK